MALSFLFLSTPSRKLGPQALHHLEYEEQDIKEGGELCVETVKVLGDPFPKWRESKSQVRTLNLGNRDLTLCLDPTFSCHPASIQCPSVPHTVPLFPPQKPNPL